MVFSLLLKYTQGIPVVVMFLYKSIPISIISRSLSSATPAQANSKKLIYVGPVNEMVKRMKTFSIGSALASTAFAPGLIYFSANHWSLFAKFGLVSSGK